MSKNILLSLINVLLVYLLAGCGAEYATYAEQVAPMYSDGMVEMVQPGATLRGLRAAANGNFGTGIMQKGNLVMLYWMQGKNTAFAVLDAGKRSAINSFAQLAGGKGNISNYNTFAELKLALEQNGWQKIGPASLPPAIVQGLQATSSWLVSLANGLPTFIFVSPVMLTPQGLPQEIES